MREVANAAGLVPAPQDLHTIKMADAFHDCGEVG